MPANFVPYNRDRSDVSSPFVKIISYSPTLGGSGGGGDVFNSYNSYYSRVVSGIVVFDSLQTLKSFQEPSADYVYQTRGWWYPGDLGHSLFYYSPTSTGQADDGGIVVTATGSGRFLLIPQNNSVSISQFGAIGDNSMHYLTDTYRGVQRFSSLSAAQTLYPPVSGTWFELLTTNDTLDSVAIQAAYRYAVNNGLDLVFPVGQYQVQRGIWLGEFEHGDATGDGTKNFWYLGGFTVRGTGRLGRQQADTYNSTGIYCAGDIANRYTLRAVNTGTGIPTVGFFTLKCYFGNVQTTGNIPLSGTPTHVKNALEALSDIGTGNVTVTCPLGLTDFRKGATYLMVLDRTLGYGTKSWHGDIQVYTNTANNSALVRCYNDASIINFRGEAQFGWKLSNLNLTGVSSYTVEGSSAYSASFGIGFAHTTFSNVEVSSISSNRVKWCVGIVENNSVNGESVLFNKVDSLGGSYGYLWTNAGQAFGSFFNHCAWGLDGSVEPGDNLARNAYEIGDGRVQGYTLNFVACQGTFGNTEANRNTLFRVKGTGAAGHGVISFLGGRYEHLTTLVDGDLTYAWNHYQTISIDNCEFTVRGNTTNQQLIRDSYQSGNGSNYSIFVRGCKFEAYNSYQTICVDMAATSYSHVSFENCKFLDFKGRVMNAPSWVMRNVTWTDYPFSNTRERIINQSLDTWKGRGEPLQNLSNPWLESGKAQNLLVNSAFSGQSTGNSAPVSPWIIRNSSGSGGVFFVDFRILSSSHSWSQFSWSDASFAFRLPQNNTLDQDIQVPLDGGDMPRVVMYRAMVAVQGTVQLRLTNSLAPSSLIYDSIQLSNTSAFTEPSMIELCAPIGGAAASGSFPRLSIKAITSNPYVQVYWHHAWLGPENASHIVSTTTNPISGTVTNWTLVTDALRSVGRFNLPYKASSRGFAASVAIPDLLPGDSYFDTTCRCVLTSNGTAYIVTGEDEMWSSDQGDAAVSWVIGNPRYILFNTPITTPRAVTLSTSNIPQGKRVTIYRTPNASGINPLTCNGYSIPASSQATFVFNGSSWKNDNISPI